MGRVRFDTNNRYYKYSRLFAAKLMCQYKGYVESALNNNEFFYRWYNKLSYDEKQQMKRDQAARKAKQASKYTGKILKGLAGLIIGYASFSKSPTSDIASSVIFDEEIWCHIYTYNISYYDLRKQKDEYFFDNLIDE